MSKVSFRARQIDFNKPLPILTHNSDLYYELGETAFISRGVPTIPSGMEREEENEHHFVEVIQALQLQKTAVIIPVPEIVDKAEDYEEIYKKGFVLPKQFIHIRTIVLADEEPIDYDMDTEDEEWLRNSDLNIKPEQFESMIDRLERGCGQKVMNLEEARLLLQDDPSLVIAVYDYWLNKRVQSRQPLLLSVRQEKRDGGSNNDPYVAFRRRSERMQTRKNRKNDEQAYEKMLILRQQMEALGDIMSRLGKREAMKESFVINERNVFQLRYKLNDWDSRHLCEAELISRKSPRPYESLTPMRVQKDSQRKRSSRKRKFSRKSPSFTRTASSEDVTDDDTEPKEIDNPFAFIRLPGCKYLRPLGPSDSPESIPDPFRYRLCRVPDIVHERRHVYTGYVRRRLGRGGRILFDRAAPPNKDLSESFDRHDMNQCSSETYDVRSANYLNYRNTVYDDHNVTEPSPQESLPMKVSRSDLTQLSRKLHASILGSHPGGLPAFISRGCDKNFGTELELCCRDNHHKSLNKSIKSDDMSNSFLTRKSSAAVPSHTSIVFLPSNGFKSCKLDALNPESTGTSPLNDCTWGMHVVSKKALRTLGEDLSYTPAVMTPVTSVRLVSGQAAFVNAGDSGPCHEIRTKILGCYDDRFSNSGPQRDATYFPNEQRSDTISRESSRLQRSKRTALETSDKPPTHGADMVSREGRSISIGQQLYPAKV